MAGLWDQVRKVLSSPKRTGSPVAVTDGPPPCSPVTDDEIEAATGHRPLGPGDRKSGGLQTDIGLFKVCQWKLTGGDEFLSNLTTCRDQAAIDLGAQPQLERGETPRWGG